MDTPRQTPPDRFHRRLLTALLLGDAVLILLYVTLGGLVVLGTLSEIPDWLALGKEASLPEVWNYIKWASIAALLFATSLRGGPVWTFPMAFVFLIILADDSLGIHENAGPALATFLPESLRGMAQAELAVFGLLGLVVLGLFAIAWRLAARTRAPGPGPGLLFGLIAVLGFFAVVVDFLHDSIPMGLIWYSIWVVIEDGGEMIVASLILSHVSGAIWLPNRARSAAISATNLRT
jgi:hypothetical protein